MDFDFTQLGAFANAASTALKVTSDAVKTVQSIKDLVGKDEASSRSEIDALLNKLMTELTLANLQNLQLSDQLKQVTNTIVAVADFQSKLSRYEEYHTPQGAILLRLKSEFQSDGVGHFVCPICVEKKREFHYVTGSPDHNGKHCQCCLHFFEFRRSDPVRGFY